MILDNSDWKKFGNSRSISLNQGIYTALSQYYPLLGQQSRELFKNLQVLRLTDAELPLAHHVLGFPVVFATASLRIFKLDIPFMGSVDPTALIDLLLAINSGSPNITDLSLELSRSQEIPAAALNAISRLQSLRALHISGPPNIGEYKNLLSFSLVPNLRTLKLSHDSFGASTDLSHNHPNPLPFHALESLSIVINEIPSSQQSFFQYLDLPNLKQLGIQLTNGAWQQFHARLHEMISSLKSSKTIESLVLEGLEKAHVSEAVPVVNITHLFSFTNLSQLVIDSLHFHIPDENTMLQRLAEAWPRLRRLTLNDISLHGAAAFPISALSYLSRHCLQLEELNIMIDARAPPLPPYPTTKDVIHNKVLHHLGLYRSPLSDPRPVADYLKYLFPELHTVRHQSLWRSHISTEYNKLWLRVNEHLGDSEV